MNNETVPVLVSKLQTLEQSEKIKRYVNAAGFLITSGDLLTDKDSRPLCDLIGEAERLLDILIVEGPGEFNQANIELLEKSGYKISSGAHGDAPRGYTYYTLFLSDFKWQLH